MPGSGGTGILPPLIDGFSSMCPSGFDPRRAGLGELSMRSAVPGSIYNLADRLDDLDAQSGETLAIMARVFGITDSLSADEVRARLEETSAPILGVRGRHCFHVRGRPAP